MEKIRISDFLDNVAAYYFVSYDGVVTTARHKKEKVLKVKKIYNHKKGYCRIELYGTKKGIKGKTMGKAYLVHRLVAMAFIPNPLNKPHVNHIDGNKLNNSADNLEWCTRSENMSHAYNTGLKSAHKFEKHHSSKLSNKQREEIIELSKTNSQSEIAKIYNMSQSGIWGVINKAQKYFQHTYGQ